MLAFLAGCSSGDIYSPGSAKVQGKDAVIFLHGYYGSALREKEGPRRFIRLSTILAGKFAIALESAKLGLRPSPELEVEGLLARVSVLPFFYENDVYGKFLAELSRDQIIVPFAYDWRRDLFSSVKELDRLVSELEGKGAKSVSFLAHSMGGLVASYYLLHGAQDPAQPGRQPAPKIRRAVFLGTPFDGAPAIFRNMNFGTGYPWNKTLLEAGTVSSWPASYHLLPLRDLKVLSPVGKESSLSLADPAFWERHRLGLLREISGPETESHRLAYTEMAVRRADAFQRRIHADLPGFGVPVLNVRGKGRPTLARGYFDGESFYYLPEQTAEKGWDFTKLEDDGDGSIPFPATALPPALRSQAKEILTDFAHDRLFSDPAVVKECISFLRVP